MMVSSVSPIRFCASADAPAVNPLERPGAFAKPQADETAQKATEAKPKKKSRKLLKTLVGLAVAAAALVTLHKTNVLKVLEPAALEGAGILKKAGHYLAKAGEAIANVTCNPIIARFKK